MTAPSQVLYAPHAFLDMLHYAERQSYDRTREGLSPGEGRSLGEGDEALAARAPEPREGLSPSEGDEALAARAAWRPVQPRGPQWSCASRWISSSWTPRRGPLARS